MGDRVEGFTFFHSYLDALKELDGETRADILWAIVCYGLDGVEPELSSPVSRAFFNLAKPNLDSSRQSVIQGKKGGRPKKEPPFSERENLPFQKAESKRKELGEELEVGIEKECIPTADKPPTHTRFCPPTIEEVRAYCQERKNQVDPEKFFDFYTSKNWMVGKNKMRDWKASIRLWERSEDRGAVSSSPVACSEVKGRWGNLQSVQLD